MDALGPTTYMALPLGPAIAGILLVGIVYGKAGYRDLLSRLFKWRVNVKWYIFSILAIPLLAMAVLLVLSLFSPEFIPALITSDDKLTLIMSGIGAGIFVAIFEEIGWTGFAVPRMKLSYGTLATGIIVGLVWGAWHFLPFWEIDTFSAAFPLTLLVLRLFSWLPPFRTLMVWIHEKTKSLLVVILIHTSLVFTTLAIPSAELSGTPLLIWLLSWGVVLWLVVFLIMKLVSKR
jgi:membrane protease YdiL (CAAX protease family)